MHYSHFKLLNDNLCQFKYSFTYKQSHEDIRNCMRNSLKLIAVLLLTQQRATTRGQAARKSNARFAIETAT